MTNKSATRTHCIRCIGTTRAGSRRERALRAPSLKGLIDEYEVYLNPLVWGEGNVHVLGDRGTIRLELADVKRFESGVVLLTYRPAS
jgi:riboflavin biosynthesis pyrimidine reductase